MSPAQTITLLSIMVTVLLYCPLMADAQSNPEDNLKIDTESVTPNTADIARQIVPKNKCRSVFKDILTNLKKWTDPDKDPEGDPENPRQFDISFNGNKTTQNLSAIATVPIYPISGYVRGQLFLMHHKIEPPPMSSDSGRIFPVSGMFQFEGNIAPRVFGVIKPRAHLEIENDTTIDTDPHLHLSIYDEIRTKRDWFKLGLGAWVEVDQIFGDTGVPTDSKNGKYRKSRNGIRLHADFECERDHVKFSTEIEYLPQLRFDAHVFSIRTSPELKIDLFCDWLSLHLIGEIDYYSDKNHLTIEPLLDLFKPFDTSLTHFVSIEF